MAISIFLSKVIGLYLLVVSAAVLINLKRFKSIIDDIMQHPGLHLVMGLNVLIIGILLVVAHNFWFASWEVIITIIAWIAFVKGILNVVFPNTAKKMFKSCMRYKNAILAIAVIDLALGLFFCYMGFIAYTVL